MLGTGVLAPRPSRGALLEPMVGSNYFYQSEFFLFNFDCPGLSLEGVRLRICSLVQLLVGNVGGPPLGCGLLFLNLSSTDAFRPSLEPGP
jgi:hypothetical protein